MADETFTDRFNRLTSGLTVSELTKVLGVTEGAVRKIRRGDTKTIELHRALALCRRLKISPWELQGEREPAGDIRVNFADENLVAHLYLAVAPLKPGGAVSQQRASEIRGAIEAAISKRFLDQAEVVHYTDAVVPTAQIADAVAKQLPEALKTLLEGMTAAERAALLAERSADRAEPTSRSSRKPSRGKAPRE